MNTDDLYKIADGRKLLSVAPMMDWTDRHCRYLHRLLTREALLYTEMVVADAAIHGKRDRLLGFDGSEHLVALQLGGSEPAKLAEATRIGNDFGYDEINLNVGCPSDRVQSGTFGACLMREPKLVADCIAAMKAASNVPVTVKCRIGVDEQDPEIALDYGRVYRLKEKYPRVFIGINGGIANLDEAVAHLAHVDGVMLGRAAYHNAAVLTGVDHRIYGAAETVMDWSVIRDAMMEHAAEHIASGGRLGHVTRHMIGLFQGVDGARRYRQLLSTDATRPGAGPDIIALAFEAVMPSLLAA